MISSRWSCLFQVRCLLLFLSRVLVCVCDDGNLLIIQNVYRCGSAISCCFQYTENLLSSLYPPLNPVNGRHVEAFLREILPCSTLKYKVLVIDGWMGKYSRRSRGRRYTGHSNFEIHHFPTFTGIYRVQNRAWVPVITAIVQADSEPAAHHVPLFLQIIFKISGANDSW
jgi:hypothetical protein